MYGCWNSSNSDVLAIAVTISGTLISVSFAAHQNLIGCEKLGWAQEVRGPSLVASQRIIRDWGHVLLYYYLVALQYLQSRP